MNKNLSNRFTGIVQIVTATLIFIWWLLMGLLLPQAEAVENFDFIVTHSNWIPINIIGLMAVVLWSISFYLQYSSFVNNLSTMGLLGFIIGQVGVILFACIQYYETFIWPIVGQLHPELVKMDGVLVFGNNLLMIPFLLSGLFLGIGYIFYCIDMLKHNIIQKSLVWFLLLGVLLFGNGIIVPIRTIGMILLVYAMIRIGLLQYKNK